MFCFAAGATHLLSALGHVFPDSHSLEKADHLGIVALIIGNPISSLMVRCGGTPKTPEGTQVQSGHRPHHTHVAPVHTVRKHNCTTKLMCDAHTAT